MENSIKVMPEMTDAFAVTAKAKGPLDENCFSKVAANHPLKHSETKYEENKRSIEMNVLRMREGLHAPLKLNMEMAMAKKVGRLPCLSSSNFQYDVLTGRHETIDFTDFLGVPENHEFLRYPHAVIEKQLGF